MIKVIISQKMELYANVRMDCILTIKTVFNAQKPYQVVKYVMIKIHAHHAQKTIILILNLIKIKNVPVCKVLH